MTNNFVAKSIVNIVAMVCTTSMGVYLSYYFSSYWFGIGGIVFVYGIYDLFIKSELRQSIVDAKIQEQNKNTIIK